MKSGFSLLLFFSLSAWGADLKLGLELTHLVSAQKEIAAFSRMAIEGRWEFHPRHQLGLRQRARKLYEVSKEDPHDFPIEDTLLYYEVQSTPGWAGLVWKIQAATTLPVSDDSRRSGNITRPSFELSFRRPFFNGMLILAYGPRLIYSFDRFTSTPDGDPMLLWSVGHEASVTFAYGNLRAGLWAKGYRNFFHPVRGVTGPSNGDYELGAAVGWRWTEFLLTQIGYLHGDTLTRDGRYQFVVYDPAAARFFASLGLTF